MISKSILNDFFVDFFNLIE